VATSAVTSQATPTVTIDTTATLPSAPTTTGPAATQPQPPPRPAGPIGWPAGRSGYTVVLNAIPRTPEGRRNALGQARSAIGRGLEQIGVLDSSRFSSLHPGYWVVFSGVFRSFEAAQRQIAEARSAGFQLAYVRQITS
jgi:cell division septation protein DedD